MMPPARKGAAMSSRLRFYLVLVASGLIALAWILTAWSADKTTATSQANTQAATASAPAASSASAPGAPPSQEVAAAIEKYLDAEAKEHHFMGSVLVSRNGQVL